MNILAIDPGSTHSGWVIMDGWTYKPIYYGKTPNELMKTVFKEYCSPLACDYVVIERIASYGMAVGRDVFDTCEWIGRFTELAKQNNCGAVEYITRKDEKLTICGSMKAKDSNIRRALIDRFAQHDMKNGKGTKANPDWFYGFKADIWQAYAVGVTWADMQKERANSES